MYKLTYYSLTHSLVNSFMRLFTHSIMLPFTRSLGYLTFRNLEATHDHWTTKQEPGLVSMMKSPDLARHTAAAHDGA